MSSGFTVKVAFDPMYVDFINSMWNDGYNTPVLAKAETGHIGMAVKSVLRKQPKTPVKKEYPKQKLVVFELPWYRDLNVQYYNYISQNGEEDLRKWVRTFFYHELHNHVIQRFNNGWEEIKGNILDFCDFHNLDPDHYNFDTLKKEYYRYRKRKDQKKARKKALNIAALLSLLSPALVLSLINII